MTAHYHKPYRVLVLLLTHHLYLTHGSFIRIYTPSTPLHTYPTAPPITATTMDATAISPTANPHATPLPIAPIDDRIEAWTVQQAADVLTASSISTPALPIRGRHRSVTLDIPLDDTAVADSPPQQRAPAGTPSQTHTVYKRKEPVRRDSLNRRQALLKGKEGTRRRQRWENDRLLSNPHAQPPLPSDWEVRPTHNAHAVPYFLAPLWDAEYARKAAARKAANSAAVKKEPEQAAADKVARDLRAKLKRAQGAKGLLQDLETEVRGFVQAWEAKQRQLQSEGLIEETDSEDEEIVFVGRNGAMSDERKRLDATKDGEMRLEKDKLVFQSLVDDHGASFGYVVIRRVSRELASPASESWRVDCLQTLCGVNADFLSSSSRYLVHAIAHYYNLKTWSVSTTDGRREAYVGLKEDPITRRPSLVKSELPRPLWAVV
jgi:hypothetical protein